ncbi:MAG TPA: DUF3568 family protein [Candidatus Brocadiia bacterium]|nr:DUF3568 family protein [Candidatus Brocadiia bacterium]
MMRLSKAAWVLLVAVCAVSLNGCLLLVAGAAGAGAISYVQGELKTTQAASLDRAFTAAKKAVDELGYITINSAKDAAKGEVVARTPSDTKITISLARVEDNITSIGIRVGIFGDEDMSRNLLDKIKRHL